MGQFLQTSNYSCELNQAAAIRQGLSAKTALECLVIIDKFAIALDIEPISEIC